MKRFTTLILTMLVMAAGFAQTGIPVPEMTNCDNLVNQFLTKHDIPSATFAMAKDGKLVYMRGFGKADLAKTEDTQPYHQFRIASISKPVTSIAIMKMIETGNLNLTDKVFGPNGIFASNAYFNNANVTDSRIFDITVKMLLEHTGGWDRDVACINGISTPYPWNTTHCDPIGFPLFVTQVYGEANPVTEKTLIKFLMEEGLAFTPGSKYAYSNIGYLTLGLIIEEKTGLSYEDYVKSAVLSPLGICDMHLGENLLADKREREGEYVGNGFSAPSVYGTGQTVPWEYGGFSVSAMDAHGGWIATARDLVRLLVGVDGFASKPDILSASSIQTMTTGSATNANYAFGWSVNQFNNWWHTGALDGTASIWVRSSGGYTWAVILNKRVIDGTAGTFWGDLDNLPWNCVSQTSTFPTHDFFDFPTSNSSNLKFKSQGMASTEVSWDSGNGNSRVVIAKEGSAVDEFPLDGTDYLGNPAFGQGDDLGGGNFVVYSGNGNSETVTGLDPTKTYYFRAFEFNKDFGTGLNALYMLCDYAEGQATTATNTGLADLVGLGIQFYPNPATDKIQVMFSTSNECDRILLRNIQGEVVKTVSVSDAQLTIDIHDLAAQVYILSFMKEGAYLGSAKIFKQ